MRPFQDQREISEGNLHGERNPSVKAFVSSRRGSRLNWTPQVTRASDPLVLTLFPFPSITRGMSGTTELLISFHGPFSHPCCVPLGVCGERLAVGILPLAYWHNMEGAGRWGDIMEGHDKMHPRRPNAAVTCILETMGH